MKIDSDSTLIVYYSRSGNTALIADMIKKQTNGDIFEVKPIQPYPENYSETTKIAEKELNEKILPDFKDKIEKIEKYEIIFIGFPNWWSTIPMVIYNFLQSYDFTGKTIVPFCTHGGGGWGNSLNDIKRLCPNSNIKDEKSFKGSNVRNQKDAVEKWIQILKGEG